MTKTPVATKAALAAAVGLAGFAVFQLLLAAGAPLGSAAWGGTHDGQLPTGLRVGSVFSVLVYVVAIAVIVRRVGLPPRWVPGSVARIGAWVVTVLLALGALENFLSRSPWERFLMAPGSLVLAGLCLVVVVRSPQEPAAASG